MKMNRLLISLCAVGCVALFVSFVLSVSAGPASAPSFAGSQFQRTVDPSERSAFGTVKFKKDGLKQSVVFQVNNLAEESFGIFIGDFPFFTTNVLLDTVSLLNRASVKKGTWYSVMKSDNGAPLEFSVNDLDDLAGTFLTVAKPEDINLLIGVTNVIGNVTNVIFGQEIPSSSTTTVFAVLWAPVPALSANPSADSFSRKANFALADSPLPNPQSKAIVQTKFNAVQGRSILDVRATGLVQGQEYSVWITDVDGLIFVPAGDMTVNRNGSSARFIRDTQFGDPLPQQSRDVRDLSGRAIVIRDKFGNVHLEGIIP